MIQIVMFILTMTFCGLIAWVVADDWMTKRATDRLHVRHQPERQYFDVWGN